MCEMRVMKMEAATVMMAIVMTKIVVVGKLWVALHDGISYGEDTGGMFVELPALKLVVVVAVMITVIIDSLNGGCHRVEVLVVVLESEKRNTFRCGHEFCYSCGAEYRESQQTCQCAFWDEDNSDDLVSQSAQESDQWAWETFNSLPMIMDAYSDQERSQLALIQRFLAGGFSLSDHHPYQSPPRCTDSYVDAMKDLHQLPWLERFVSVISDNYYEDYMQ
ncbi:hypothetical protein Pint_11607 [Pistacia integerrima]|uniref:Uncharacterized protein n=1 Tax=Pistacia integerrima TaxID=434235 RepID=A0ACC0XIU0_9ROSI|nr:hypothetical protein Pint_11607 [Pistacia integerrima]